MAVSTSPIVSPFRSFIGEDTDVTNAAVKDVMNGPGYLHAIVVDNTGGAAFHLKLYDNGNPTVGGTDPDWILFVPAAGIYTFLFKVYTSAGIYESGVYFATGLSWAGVTEAGTAGTTDPSATPDVHFACDITG